MVGARVFLVKLDVLGVDWDTEPGAQDGGRDDPVGFDLQPGAAVVVLNVVIADVLDADILGIKRWRVRAAPVERIEQPDAVGTVIAEQVRAAIPSQPLVVAFQVGHPMESRIIMPTLQVWLSRVVPDNADRLPGCEIERVDVRLELVGGHEAFICWPSHSSPRCKNN